MLRSLTKRLDGGCVGELHDKIDIKLRNYWLIDCLSKAVLFHVLKSSLIYNWCLIFEGFFFLLVLGMLHLSFPIGTAEEHIIVMIFKLLGRFGI